MLWDEPCLLIQFGSKCDIPCCLLLELYVYNQYREEKGGELLIPTIRMLVDSKRCSSERRGRGRLRMDVSGGEDEWERMTMVLHSG
jgi:hypothetical protein